MPGGTAKGDSVRTTLREALVRRIEAGEWRPSDRLPSEPALAASMGVSRATLRDALRSLEEDGFVTRLQGSGTFVTHRLRMKNNLDVNFGVTDLIRSMGMRPGTRHSRTFGAEATAEEAGLLAVEVGSPLRCLERVRTADGQPVVLSVDLIPEDRLGNHPDLLDEVGEGSVYDVLERAIGVVVRQGVASIRPANADDELAARLGVPAGTLLLYLRQVDYDLDGRPVLLSHEHHLADAFEITVVRRGPGPSTKEST
ncbi:MAG TPA: GntR family transcriptional regulator [Actinomycetota bacterium]|nr:GntR family transcriptional regulator [Actinomycetota bacterium]